MDYGGGPCSEVHFRWTDNKTKKRLFLLCYYVNATSVTVKQLFLQYQLYENKDVMEQVNLKSEISYNIREKQIHWRHIKTAMLQSKKMKQTKHEINNTADNNQSDHIHKA